MSKKNVHRFQTFKQIFAPIDKSKILRPSFETLFFMIVSAVGFSLAPLYLGKWIGEISKGTEQIYIYFAIYIFCYGIAYVTRDFQWFPYSKIEKIVHQVISSKLLEKTLTDKNTSETGIGSISSAFQGINSFLFCTIFIIVPFSLEIFGMLITIVSSLSVLLGVQFLIFTGGFLFILNWTTESISEKNKNFVSTWNNSLDYFSQILSRKSLFNKFNAKSLAHQKVKEVIENRENSRISVARIRVHTTFFLNLWISVLLGVQLLTAIWLFKNGQLQIGEVVAVEAFFFQLLRRLEVWARGYRESAIGADQCDFIIKYLKDKNQLSFKTPDSNNILSNLEEIPVRKKSWNLIIGRTGTGKSTYLKTMESRDFKNTIFMPQQPDPLPMSFKENITLGRNFDSEVYKQLIFGLQLDKVIKRLPNGENTILDIEGNPLSGGELQRLSLARTLLVDKDILLLDEPTSHQSPSQEVEIFRFVRSITKGKTVVVVSHSEVAKNFTDYLWIKKGFTEFEKGHLNVV